LKIYFSAAQDLPSSREHLGESVAGYSTDFADFELITNNRRGALQIDNKDCSSQRINRPNLQTIPFHGSQNYMAGYRSNAMSLHGQI